MLMRTTSWLRRSLEEILKMARMTWGRIFLEDWVALRAKEGLERLW